MAEHVGPALVDMVAHARRLLTRVRDRRAELTRDDEHHLCQLRLILQDLAGRGRVSTIASLPEKVS